VAVQRRVAWFWGQGEADVFAGLAGVVGVGVGMGVRELGARGGEREFGEGGAARSAGEGGEVEPAHLEWCLRWCWGWCWRWCWKRCWRRWRTGLRWRWLRWAEFSGFADLEG